MEPCREQAGDGGIDGLLRSSVGIVMGSGVEPYMIADAFTGLMAGLLVLVLDLMLGVREEALDRDRWTPSNLSRDRLRVEEELPDDMGETGRSISFRRLSLATLKTDVELRGFASCPWSITLEWVDLGEGSGEGGRDLDLIDAGRGLDNGG